MNSQETINTKQIPEILILTHGYFGRELIKSAEMIVGSFQGVHFIPLVSDILPDEYLEEIIEIVEKMPHGSFIFVDLFGGTPSNITAKLSSEYDIYALSGVNLPMLIEAINMREHYFGEELNEMLLESSKEGCKDVIGQLRELC